MGARSTVGLGGCGGFGWGGLGGVEVDGAGGFVESPKGDCGEEDDDGPESDEDGGGPLGGEACPETEDGAAVVDAEPDCDCVARQAAEGEGPHEFFARHVHGAGGEDEGRERHGRRQDGGERDGEDGVLFHPDGDAFEDARGDVFLEEGHASGLTGGVGEEAADGGAEGRDGDEEDGVGVGGGVEDEHDVGYAGDGEGDEGAIDYGDEEEADEAEPEEEVDEGIVMRVLGLRGEEEEGDGGRGDVDAWAHAAVMTLAGKVGTRKSFSESGDFSN
jgi:hypothetical protein